MRRSLLRETPNDFVVEDADVDLTRVSRRAANRKTATTVGRQLVRHFRADVLREQELHPPRSDSQRSGTDPSSEHRRVTHRFEGSRR